MMPGAANIQRCHAKALNYLQELRSRQSRCVGVRPLLKLLGIVLTVTALSTFDAAAKDAKSVPQIALPVLNLAPPDSGNEVKSPLRRLTLSAKLTEDEEPLKQGIVWRVFKPGAEQGEKLPLVATASGGTATIELAPGSYLVHCAFGRAGVTKRITLGKESRKETMVLDAGGLKLSAVLSGGVRIPPEGLRFSIYERQANDDADGTLIVPDVKPDTIVRLNSGTYHVVSTYGSVNAIIRADIRVEAGKLTEATVEHKAAELTLKLVRETGGEAIADTSWSVVNPSGEIVKESVGAFASMVLAEGDYTIIAKNKDKLYQKDFTVVAGHNQDVDVLAVE